MDVLHVLCLLVLYVSGVCCLNCGRHTIITGFSPRVHLKSDGFPYEPYKTDTNDCWIIINSDGGSLFTEVRDLDTYQDHHLSIFEYDVSANSYRERFAHLSHKLTKDTFASNMSSIMITWRAMGDYSYYRRRGWQACVCGEELYSAYSGCGCGWDKSPAEVDGELTPREGGGGGMSYAGRIVLAVVAVVVMLGIMIGIVILAVWVGRRNRRRRMGGPGVTISHATGTPMRPVTESTPMQPPGYPTSGRPTQPAAGYPVGYPTSGAPMHPATGYPAAYPTSSAPVNPDTGSYPTKGAAMEPGYGIPPEPAAAPPAYSDSHHYPASEKVTTGPSAPVDG